MRSSERSAPTTLVEHMERTGHALTADDLAKLLSVSGTTIFKQAKAARIPSFRIGTSVRFCKRLWPTGSGRSEPFNRGRTLAF
jgi:excisionase family DNA binding protein